MLQIMPQYRKPNKGLPVETAAIKPQIAPIIIIPSTPKFRTPDFSTINSPVAANKIGVAATIKVAIKDTIEMSII